MSAADAHKPVTLTETKSFFAGLSKHSALVLAVSGGPDSTALLYLASRWRAGLKSGPNLIAVTVDHGLRMESASEAKAVARLCRKLGVTHKTLRWTGTKPKTGLQDAARRARYDLLAKEAARRGARHVLTAHTLDDQAETILFRLSRGSGLSGLAAMARESELSGVVIVRPLLDVPKARLIATLRKARIAFADDPSNRDPRFTRPRWREIMPLLAKEGLSAQRLSVLAARIRRAEAALTAAVTKAADTLSRGPGPRARASNSRRMDFSGCRTKCRFGSWAAPPVMPATRARSSSQSSRRCMRLCASGEGPFPTAADVSAPDGNGVSQYKAVVPIAPANDTADAEDEIVVSSVAQEFAGSSDDANVYTMYNQAVTGVTTPLAPGFSSSIQLGGGDLNEESRWNITVVDQEGDPIQGLDVCEVASTADLEACNGAGNGTPDAGETDVNGVFQASLFEPTLDNATDRNPAANVQSTYYLVDVDQNGFFISGIDFRVELTQTAVSPVASTVEFSSELGTTLDDDEVSDVFITIKDQNGNPLGNKVGVFNGELRCINAPAADVVVPFGPIPFLSGPDGRVFVGALGDEGGTCEDGPYTWTLDAFANNDGDPNPGPGDAIAETTVLDFDRTEVVWDNGDATQAENGTTTTQSATLQQVDGDALSGDRIIQIDYSPATTARSLTRRPCPRRRSTTPLRCRNRRQRQVLRQRDRPGAAGRRGARQRAQRAVHRPRVAWRRDRWRHRRRLPAVADAGPGSDPERLRRWHGIRRSGPRPDPRRPGPRQPGYR